MRAILTGATGFVGSNLKTYLKKKGWEIETIGREDSSESMDLKMRTFHPNVVFHLATLFVSEHKVSDIGPLVESNVIFGTQLVDAMVRNNILHLVNTGTLWQYFQGQRETPSSLYAATKSAFESILRFYTSANSLKVLNLMLSDTFGPQDSRAKILPKLLKIAGTSETLQMSAGDQIIEWTYISDITEAFEIAAHLLMSGSEKGYFVHYSAGSGEQHSLKETVAICEQVLGKRIHVQFGAKPYRNHEIMKPYKLDPTLPGWKAKVSFQEGIRVCAHD